MPIRLSIVSAIAGALLASTSISAFAQTTQQHQLAVQMFVNPALGAPVAAPAAPAAPVPATPAAPAAPGIPAAAGPVTAEVAKAMMVVNGFTDLGMTQMRGTVLLVLAKKNGQDFVVGVDLATGQFLGGQPVAMPAQPAAPATPPAATPPAVTPQVAPMAITPQPRFLLVQMTATPMLDMDQAKAIMSVHGFTDIGPMTTRGPGGFAVAMKANALFLVGVDLRDGRFLGAQPFMPEGLAQAATPAPRQTVVTPPPRRAQVATVRPPVKYRPSFNPKRPRIAATGTQRPIGTKTRATVAAFNPKAPIGFDFVLGPVYLDPLVGPFVIDPVLGPILLDQPLINAAALINSGLIDPVVIGFPVNPFIGPQIAINQGLNPQIIGGMGGPVMIDPQQGAVFIDPVSGLPVVYPDPLPGQDPNQVQPVPYVDPQQQESLRMLVDSVKTTADPNNPNVAALNTLVNLDPNQPNIIPQPGDAEQQRLMAEVQKRLANPTGATPGAPLTDADYQKLALDLGITDANNPLTPEQLAFLKDTGDTFKGHTAEGLANTGVNQAIIANPEQVKPEALENRIANDPTAVDPNAVITANLNHPIGKDFLNQVVQSAPQATDPALVADLERKAPGTVDVNTFADVAQSHPTLVEKNLLNSVIQGDPANANPDRINRLAAAGLVNATSLAEVAATHPGMIDVGALNQAIQADPAGVDPQAVNQAALADPGSVSAASLIAVGNERGFEPIDNDALNQAIQVSPGTVDPALLRQLGTEVPGLFSAATLQSVADAQPNADLNGIPVGDANAFAAFDLNAAAMRSSGLQPGDGPQGDPGAAQPDPNMAAVQPTAPADDAFMTFQTQPAADTAAVPPPPAPAADDAFMTFQTQPAADAAAMPPADAAAATPPTIDPNAALGDPFAQFQLPDPGAVAPPADAFPQAQVPADTNALQVDPFGQFQTPQQPGTAPDPNDPFGQFQMPGAVPGGDPFAQVQMPQDMAAGDPFGQFQMPPAAADPFAMELNMPGINPGDLPAGFDVNQVPMDALNGALPPAEFNPDNFFDPAQQFEQMVQQQQQFDPPPDQQQFDQQQFDPPPDQQQFDQQQFDPPPDQQQFDQQQFDPPPDQGFDPGFNDGGGDPGLDAGGDF